MIQPRSLRSRVALAPLAALAGLAGYAPAAAPGRPPRGVAAGLAALRLLSSALARPVAACPRRALRLRLHAPPLYAALRPAGGCCRVSAQKRRPLPRPASAASGAVRCSTWNS